jgi:hypothetical protein
MRTFNLHKQKPIVKKMKNTHTPGPWATFKNPHLTSDRLDIASAQGTYSPCHIASDALPADAQLISAAPELLDALSGAVAYAEMEGGFITPPYWYTAAKCAIAKARGVLP